MKNTAWALYVVSSDGQNAASQRNTCKKIADKEGFRITHEIDGVSSGKHKVRAIVDKMVKTLADMKLRGDALPEWLVVVREDRLGRDKPFEMLKLKMQLQSLGVRIFTQQPYGERKMETTAEQRSMFEASAMAHEENAMRIQKVTDSYATRRDAGEIARNMAPYGLTFSPDRTRLVALEPEAAAVRLAFRLRVEGNGHTHIGRELMRKAPPRSYKKGARAYAWTTATVNRLLKNRDYVGPVVDELTFLRAQKVSLGRVNESGQRRYSWPLGGALLCGLCGRHMGGVAGGSDPKARIRYYYCNNIGHSTRHGIAAAKVEAMFVEQLRAIEAPLGPEGLEAHAAVDARRAGATSLGGGAIAEKTKLRAALEADKKKVVGLFTKGLIAEEDVQPELDRFKREIAEVDAALAKLRDEELLLSNRAKQVREAREFARKAALLFADPDADEDIKRQIARKVSELTGGFELTVDKTLRFKSALL